MSIIIKNRYLNWEPNLHTYIKDTCLRETIHTKGFEVKSILNHIQVEKLREIYQSEHSFDVKDGGMFYSMYSKDKAYRRRVHESIGEILKPILDQHFSGYKNVINSFVVKLPGEKSEFYVHQDTTGLDEFQFSPLSLWIPLQDITPENGALAVIEKTQWFFSPYRGVSFAFPFKNINDTIKKYLDSVYMKTGEVLIFDNRIIHNSMANTTNESRVAIICGLFPKEAEFISCYKDQSKTDSPIELYHHEENYLLEYPHFFYNCTDRPSSGKIIKKVVDLFPDMSSDEFEELCNLNKIPERNIITNADPTTVNCQLIAEPDGINKFDESVSIATEKKSFLKRLFN
jgi:ectoine hydroxylase-related dioxygenase (phytanoyl-CoA dioxygenase family)